MKQISTATIALLTLTFSLSFITLVWGNGFEYETVGGTISQTNFITAFTVPAVIIACIFGAVLLFAYVRIRAKQTS